VTVVNVSKSVPDVATDGNSMGDTPETMWNAFVSSGLRDAATAAGSSYGSWSFGDSAEMADRLVELVLSGRKRATAGSLWGYEADEEPLPEVGEFSVITDGAGVARCIIRTTAIDLVPFSDVDESFARAEGEGDRSLEYWRQGHWAYFSRELEEIGREPEADMLIVCEHFEVVFPVRESPLSESTEPQ
jgi:uncharacterized protein YhfF